VGTNLFVDGYYTYFWGYYPRAGLLHPIHVLQTVIVVNRGLYITWRAQQTAPHDQQSRLRLCVASLLIYFFAAVDYLCNYGFEFYPPGVVFIAISLGLIAFAVTRFNLMSRAAVAATVAHEMRTPLASIRMLADTLSQMLPELDKGYRLALEHGLVKEGHNTMPSQQLMALTNGIAHQVDRSNVVIDMVLASSRMEQIDTSTFGCHSMQACVAEALTGYPFSKGERDKVAVTVESDFVFRGSDLLMVYVLFNLIKNSIYAMRAAGKGAIAIKVASGTRSHTLTFTDTGCGIPAATLPRIFDDFFTTKKTNGAGIGLAFCRRVLTSFGACMNCESVEGSFTTFTMRFPMQASSQQPPASVVGAGAAIA
jgi:signal transduction histidine kinase